MDEAMRAIPTCSDLARAVTDGTYSQGAWHVRWRLRLHMVVCWVCRRYVAQIRWIERAATAMWAPSRGVDPDFKRRLVTRLRSGLQ
jgi:hypothetical protein